MLPPLEAPQLKAFTLSSNHSAALAKSKVMTMVDGAVTVHIILAGIQWTTRITETGITNLTRITNKMVTSSNYLMKYLNGFLAVILK